MKAVAALVTVAGVAGLLIAGVWLAGGEDEAPVAGAERPPAALEDPDVLVCEEAPRNPQIATKDAWARTLAGYWIDESEGNLYFAFTEGAEEEVARLTECFPERTFTPVTFERSLQEMEAVLDQMLPDREAIRGGTL